MPTIEDIVCLDESYSLVLNETQYIELASTLRCYETIGLTVVNPRIFISSVIPEDDQEKKERIERFEKRQREEQRLEDKEQWMRRMMG